MVFWSVGWPNAARGRDGGPPWASGSEGDVERRCGPIRVTGPPPDYGFPSMTGRLPDASELEPLGPTVRSSVA